MTIKITTPNGGSDSLDFGCAQTPNVAAVTGTEVSSGEGKLEFKTTTGGTSAAKMTVTAGGNVGIGATSPLAKNHTLGAGTAVVASGSDGAAEAIIEGANIALTNSYGNLNVISNTAQAADTGGQIAFAGKSTDSDNKYATWAVIKGAKENATSANIASYLAFSTRANGGGNTEKLRITSAGSVGIGTATPSTGYGGAISNVKLALRGAGAGGNNGTATLLIGGDNNHYSNISSEHIGGGLTYLSFGTSPNAGNPTEKMRIDAAGYVGIGCTPINNLQVHSPTSASGQVQITNNSTGATTGDGVIIGFDGSNQAIFNNKENTPMIFSTNNTEHMRLDSAGHLLVGTTDTTPWDNAADSTADNGIAIRDGGLLAATRYQSNPLALNRTGNNGTIVDLRRTGTIKGTIGITTTAVTYNTTSDYRLKENVEYDWDATSRLKQLKPARFNFIADPDNTVDGFLAHEAQEVVPESVTGVKDEVDDDDNPVMQGIDQAKLVPLLVKTIQELEARIAKLEENK